MLRWNGGRGLLKLLLVRMWIGSEESRTEIRRHQCSEEIFDISAKEHSQSADTKHTTIAVWVASLKLLEGSRDVGKPREEDVYH